MLIDACQSGEADDKGTARTDTEKLEGGNEANVKEYPRGMRVTNTGKKSSGNSFVLIQSLFDDINRGNGTYIISASAGSEFVLEGSNGLKNGVFSYSFMKGLNEKEADSNFDAQVSISELKDYMLKTVRNLTGSKQHPNFRGNVSEVDWRVW